MIITQDISLDVFNTNSFKVVHAKQFDENSRFLRVTIYSYGDEISIEADSTIVLCVKRADSKERKFAGEVNADGTLNVPLPNWMLEVEGLCVCNISIIKDGQKFSTLNFKVQVEKASNNGDEITEDENYDVLVSLVSRVEQLNQKMNTAEAQRDSAELARKEAEAERVKAEDERKQYAEQMQQVIESADEIAENVALITDIANTLSIRVYFDDAGYPCWEVIGE